MEDDFRIVMLKCSGCGAALEISDDTDRFACSYCGVQQQVVRRGGIIALKLIGEDLRHIRANTDKAALELEKITNILEKKDRQETLIRIPRKAINEKKFLLYLQKKMKSPYEVRPARDDIEILTQGLDAMKEVQAAMYDYGLRRIN